MIIAYDTETYEYDKKEDCYKPVLDARKFIIGCVKTDTGITKFFQDAEKMFEWIKDRIKKEHNQGRKTYIYAHNAEYDWYAIGQKHLLDKEVKYILFGNFLMAYDGKAYFADTMSFYRTSLERIGKSLGYKKMEMPMRIKHPMELNAYVERDTEIVLKAIMGIKERLLKLGFKPRKLLTAGQLAMTCFLTYCRKNGKEQHFTQYNIDKKRREIIPAKHAKIIRSAYRGGDNQAHKTGKYHNVSMVDINGLYSYNMREMRFPDLKTEMKHDNITIGMLKEYIKQDIGIARLTIKSPNTTNPVLPIRFGEYQVFPSNTRMRGTWTFLELGIALKEGYKIEKIEWAIRWKELEIEGKKFNPLKDFINELYPLEQKSESEEEKGVIKLLRNNLSGKFAQYRKNKDYKIVNRAEVMGWIEQGYESVSKYDNKYIIVKETTDYDPSYTNPIISTIITAMGRLRIHEEKKKIPYEDRLYNDTDSLMFIDKTGETLKKFKIGKELGEWKIEAKNVTAKILGEKRYYIDWKVKISGVHKAWTYKENIEEESTIKTARMKGIGTALQSGEWDRVGEFETIEFEMKQHSKNDLALPDYIDETRMEE